MMLPSNARSAYLQHMVDQNYLINLVSVAITVGRSTGPFAKGATMAAVLSVADLLYLQLSQLP
jgi:hypothetical protein